MQTKIQKWGNSLAVRLPKQIAKKFSLNEGSVVTVTNDKTHVLIHRVKRPHLGLKDLIARIDSKNMHKETGWGSPRGKEIW